MSNEISAGRLKTPAELNEQSTVLAGQHAAADAGVPLVQLVVDGKPVSVPKGTLVIEAAFSAGSDIPYFCYHPRLSSVGACRMCLASVELEMFGQRRASIMATCTIPVSDGMVVKTQTPDVRKAQNGILELVLANHPLDCPICDRGGECPLQNMTVAYGPPNTRFIEEKRRYVKALPISDHVVLDRERCITCMRCTRFATEIAGDSKLGLINRGAQSEVGPFLGGTFDSNFSGNTIEICPVGALTSRQFRFKGRPWEVKSGDSICTKCSNGCNISVGHRMGEIVRINGRTNEAINEEWTCDRGKFGNNDVNSDSRLSVPLVRDAYGNLIETDWNTALSAIVGNLQFVRESYGVDAIAGVGSETATLEDNLVFFDFLRNVVGTSQIVSQLNESPKKLPLTSLVETETLKHIVTVALDFPMDQPMYYLRAVKAQRHHGAKLESVPDVSSLMTITLTAESVVFVNDNLPKADYELLSRLTNASGAKVSVLVSKANSFGALLASWTAGRQVLVSDLHAGLPADSQSSDVFSAMADGRIRHMFVMSSNPVSEFHDSTLVKRAFDNECFTVVVEQTLTETAKCASVVLPSCSFAEKAGSYINVDGHLQTVDAVIEPRGSSRPEWRIMIELMARMGAPAPYYSPQDILAKSGLITKEPTK